MAPTSSGQQLPANSKPVDSKVKTLWEDTTEGYTAAPPRRTRRMPPAYLQRMSGMHACTLASRAVGPRPHQQGVKAGRLQLLPGDLPKGFPAAAADVAGGSGGGVDGGDVAGPKSASSQLHTKQQAGAAAADLPPPPRATFYVKDPGSCTRRGASRQRTSTSAGGGSDAVGGGGGGSSGGGQPLQVQLPGGGGDAASDASDASSLPSPVALQDAEPAGGGDQQAGTLESIYPSGWSSLPDSSSPSSLGAGSSPRSPV
jgi:hypothetical protein